MSNSVHVMLLIEQSLRCQLEKWEKTLLSNLINEIELQMGITGAQSN